MKIGDQSKINPALVPAFREVKDQLEELGAAIDAHKSPGLETLADWAGQLKAITRTTQAVATGDGWQDVAKLSSAIFQKLLNVSPRPDALRARLTEGVAELLDGAGVKDQLVLGPKKFGFDVMWRGGEYRGPSSTLSLKDDTATLYARTPPGSPGEAKPPLMLLVGDRVYQLGAPKPGQIDTRTDRDDPPDMEPITSWSVDVKVKPGEQVVLLDGDAVKGRWTAV
jgi:hypothetical protein